MRSACEKAEQALADQTPVMNTGTKPDFVIKKLTREHDLSEFDCANATLNDWLRRFAWTNQQADSAKTYLALDRNRIAGYYALTTGSVHKHESPQRIAKGLANHPIGVVLLARLAVDRTQQGKGLRKALLFDALSRIEEAADIVGVRAVLVHAIDEAARRFYLHFEFEESPVNPYQLLLLLKELWKAIHEA
jgi:GNAT superfamily N-acetyltransferase